jgi:SAM-dependent methyltransferase
MSVLARIHGDYIFQRRTRVLADALAELLPPRAHVLDVGTGDGTIAARIAARRPDLTLRGVDVLVRPRTHIPVEPFDGRTLPVADGAVDVVMFVDVLHHTDDPNVLLREAARAARRAVVIKDHTRDGLLAGPTLRLMDWVGNARHHVVLPYNYWPESRWRAAFDALGLVPAVWKSSLALYPPPLGWVFDRSLHFVARLEKRA